MMPSDERDYDRDCATDNKPMPPPHPDDVLATYLLDVLWRAVPDHGVHLAAAESWGLVCVHARRTEGRSERDGAHQGDDIRVTPAGVDLIRLALPGVCKPVNATVGAVALCADTYCAHRAVWPAPWPERAPQET
jgi:hypothetical protein